MTVIWAEYIWLDADNNYRSKTKIMEKARVISLKDTILENKNNKIFEANEANEANEIIDSNSKEDQITK